VNSLVYQPIHVPAQFGFVDGAAGVERYDMGRQNAVDAE
jgi:hypothetical protein